MKVRRPRICSHSTPPPHHRKDPKSVWSAELWGRNRWVGARACPAVGREAAAYAPTFSATSWVNSFPIPFVSSARITLQFMGATGGATIYYQAHGLDGVAATFGRVPLPATARLVLQHNDLVLPRLAYLPVSSFASGRGLVAAIALAFVAPNLNTVSGPPHGRWG